MPAWIAQQSLALSNTYKLTPYTERTAQRFGEHGNPGIVPCSALLAVMILSHLVVLSLDQFHKAEGLTV